MGYAYSFLDVHAAISGPGGNFPLSGDRAGIAQEGLTITPTGDKNVMLVGADGAVMHSLSADASGSITVNLLRNSPVNRLLQNLYNYQAQSSANWGRNTITVRDVARGDTVTCQEVAFAKAPDKVFAKEGGTLQWTFHAGKIEGQIGSGTPELE
nr:MAG TPA: Protein of unknown function (DUF3277) [Caudoviricetes sp.]